MCDVRYERKRFSSQLTSGKSDLTDHVTINREGYPRSRLAVSFTDPVCLSGDRRFLYSSGSRQSLPVLGVSSCGLAITAAILVRLCYEVVRFNRSNIDWTPTCQKNRDLPQTKDCGQAINQLMSNVPTGHTKLLRR